MRALLIVLLLMVNIAPVDSQTLEPAPPLAWPAESTPPPPDNITYFLVDASGSMKEEVEEASKKLAAKVTLLDAGSWKSVTFFGGKSPSSDHPVGCDDEITVSMATSPETSVPTFPTLGGYDDKTAIGKGLEAVLLAGGKKASVVLITDGAEECDTDFSSIRMRYPYAEIKVLQVGKTPNAALGLLEIKPRVGQSSVPVSGSPLPIPLPISLVPSPPESESGWRARISWMIVLAISALAAMFFCLQSGERTKSLQDQLVQLEKKTIEELGAIYTPTKKNRKGKVVRKRDGERFRLYWFRNRDHGILKSYGLWALVFLGLAAVGWLGLTFDELALLAFSESFTQAVRHDSWHFLNSNIGAYSFVGTIVSLFGFSAFQWWQTLEAKRELMIRSGIIAEERAKVARNQYARVRRAILAIRFVLPKITTYWSLLPPEQVEIPGFDALQAKLLELAAPRFEDASPEKHMEIESFARIRDPLAFAQLLKQEGRLSQTQFDMIVRLLECARQEELQEAAEITQQLVEELGGPAGKEISG
jgi:hypothetical protein